MEVNALMCGNMLWNNKLILAFILFLIFIPSLSIGKIPITNEMLEQTGTTYEYEYYEGYNNSDKIEDVYIEGSITYNFRYSEDEEINGSKKEVYLCKSKSKLKTDLSKINHGESIYWTNTTSELYVEEDSNLPICEKSRRVTKYIGDNPPSTITFNKNYLTYQYPNTKQDFLRDKGDMWTGNISYNIYASDLDISQKCYINSTFQCVDYIYDFEVKEGVFDVVKIKEVRQGNRISDHNTTLFLDVNNGLIVKSISYGQESNPNAIMVTELKSINNNSNDDSSTPSLSIISASFIIVGIAIVWAHGRKEKDQ